MIRTFYHNITGTDRSLSLEEIAAACNVSPRKVMEWFAPLSDDRHREVPRHVDALEATRFLIDNRLPVPARLLPPKTKKLLLIPSRNCLPETTAYWADLICNAFSNVFNILLESLSSGERPQMAILAGKPDLVVVLLYSYNRLISTTLSLLDGDPAIKTLLIVSEKIKFSIDQGLICLPAERIVADNLEPGQMAGQITGIFDC